jgi:putative transposase
MPRRVREQTTKGQTARQAARRPKDPRSATPATQIPVPLDDGTVTTPGGSVTLAMIQALIPLGLRAVEEALQAEVRALAGERYAHADAHPDVVRWGQQRGSVYLADQKLPVTVPRVRDRRERCEIPLATYAALQTPRGQDVGLFRKVLGGLSCREYEAAAEAVPEAFGLARSSVSRRFIRSSARELKRLQERRLDDAEWLALVMDGKTFAGDQIVIALGVTVTGEKRILGLVQTATENKRVCAAFLRELEERGFRSPNGLLAVLDGAKGLRAAVREVFGDTVEVQRCQWHKRENVVSYLARSEQTTWRRKLEAAYAHPLYADARRALLRLVRELAVLNESAARSLEEGLEETLTLHRLGIFPELGVSFRTTNLIESVMARLEEKTARVDRWRTSDQKRRWCGAALLAVEQQFRRVKGYQHLPLLVKVLRAKMSSVTEAAA